MMRALINSVKCNTSRHNPDKVFIVYQSDAGVPIRYPVGGTHPMTAGQVWQNSDGTELVSIPYESGAYFSLWGEELPVIVFEMSGAKTNESPKILGNDFYNQRTQSKTVTLNGSDGAQYVVDVTIIPSSSQSSDREDEPVSLDLVTEAKAARAQGANALKHDTTGTFADVDPDLLRQAGVAVREWSESPEGAQAIANAKSLPPAAAGQAMAAAFASPSISTIIAKILQKIPLKAVSIGLLGQVELVVGIAGTIGYAIDIGDVGETSALYLGLGALEGVDGGAEGVAVLGLWAEPTASINGFYVGASVDIDDGVGVYGAAFASSADKDKFNGGDGGVNLKYAKMLFIGADAGIEDGVDADEYYFFTHTMSSYPVYQPQGTYNYMMNFLDLSCADSKDSRDTVFILYKVDGGSTVYRYPIWGGIYITEPKHAPKDGPSTWICGNMVRFNSSVEATITVGNYHKMPWVTFSPSDFSGLYSACSPKALNASTDAGLNKIKYTLNAQLEQLPS